MTEVFYLAICHDCEPVLPVPFGEARERAKWVTAHREGTGHRVTIKDEARISSSIAAPPPPGAADEPR